MGQRHAVRLQRFAHRREKLFQQSNIGIFIKYYRYDNQLNFKLQYDAGILPNQNIVHRAQIKSR
jgi:hypothetical protein